MHACRVLGPHFQKNKLLVRCSEQTGWSAQEVWRLLAAFVHVCGVLSFLDIYRLAAHGSLEDADGFHACVLCAMGLRIRERELLARW